MEFQTCPRPRVQRALYTSPIPPVANRRARISVGPSLLPKKSGLRVNELSLTHEVSHSARVTRDSENGQRCRPIRIANDKRFRVPRCKESCAGRALRPRAVRVRLRPAARRAARARGCEGAAQALPRPARELAAEAALCGRESGERHLPGRLGQKPRARTL
jgi:hypothetical protein